MYWDNTIGLEIGHWVEPVTTMALGVIAYLMGGSMMLNQLRGMGWTIIGAAIGESVGAVLMVFIAMLILAPEIRGVSALSLALAFAGIAAATAPAGKVAILHQYRAKGPLSTT